MVPHQSGSLAVFRTLPPLLSAFPISICLKNDTRLLGSLFSPGYPTNSVFKHKIHRLLVVSVEGFQGPEVLLPVRAEIQYILEQDLATSSVVFAPFL
jgi:hypothetical protein